MTKHQYRFDGNLARMPFPGKPSAALARMMPIENENDFSVFAELPCSDAPIRLNFIEHYQILADLVSAAQKLWPEGLTIVVQMSMPAGMRLPAPLLAANVLLVQDVDPERRKLLKSDAELLVIEDKFIRYQLEKGNNDIHITLYSKDAEQQPAFDQFVAPLAELGVETL